MRQKKTSKEIAINRRFDNDLTTPIVAGVFAIRKRLVWESQAALEFGLHLPAYDGGRRAVGAQIGHDSACSFKSAI